MAEADATHAPDQQAAAPRKLPVRGFLRRQAGTFGVLLVLYVLSSGPMFWTWYEAVYFSRSPFISRLYYPLVWFGEHFPRLNEWLTWYVELWIV